MAFYVVWDAEITNRPGLEPYVAAVSAADEIGRLRNTLRTALAATDFVWAKQLIRQALN